MRPRAGFTLLEMMVALLVAATLVTGAVQAFRGITSAQQRAAGRLDRGHYAEIFLDRLERELGGSLLIVKHEGDDRLAHPYLFVGEDRFDSEHDVDALRFITQNPARSASDPVGPGLRMISYAVVSGLEGGFALVRQEERVPDGMQKEIELVDPQPVFDDVAQFKLRYLDELSGEWRDSWDSTDVALLDRLPLEVEVEVSLLEPDEAGELQPVPARRRRIPLPVRELDVAELRAAAYGRLAEGGEQECVTVSECVGRFQSLLAGASAATARSIALALAESPEACWDPDSELADRLRAMGGDPDEVCAR